MDKINNHVEHYIPKDDVPKTSAYAMPGIRNRPPTFSKALAVKILQCLADYYKVELSLLIGIRRDQPYPYIRHVFVYWMRRRYDKKAAYMALGSVLGNRDHTTVINSEKVYQERLNTNDSLRDNEQIHSKMVREDYLKTSKYLQSCLMEIKVDLSSQ